MVGVKKENNTKNIAIFWVTGLIGFVALEYGIYKSENIKMDCEIDILDKLKNYLKINSILNQD